jgi:CxxC motif-containing protein (DUF1111 family)
MRRLVTVMLILVATSLSHAVNTVRDPGVRSGPASAGGPLAGLTPDESALFEIGQQSFQEVEDVARGLGPRFNLDSCGGCHAHPAVGGSSPTVNPQVAVASKAGAVNAVPYFILPNGPIREARFKYRSSDERDGGVHNLYTITGRTDAAGCRISQPDFERESQRRNIAFRIPTPLFGGGLIEAILDRAILENLDARREAGGALGIAGRPNRRGPGRVVPSGSPNVSGNDGSITRFGWKAQNPSLLVFAGEAYNVEMGVTNALFPIKRDETSGCQFNPTPEDGPQLSAASVPEGLSDIEKFAAFMRFLAPPAPASPTPSSQRGARLFREIGCALCHTPVLWTGRSSTAALSYQPVPLFSDLLLHHMGRALADDIYQGAAESDEFRSAPLWGVGQRLFLLHDGRTTNLLVAIQAHASDGSEANESVKRFNRLRDSDQQDILNFLRSL